MSEIATHPAALRQYVAHSSTQRDGPASDCPSGCGRLARRAKFRFTETPNQRLISGHPVPTRGAVARRHERGMGCGGRESVGAQVRSQGGLNLVSDCRRARRTTFERTAKPCGPDTRCWCQVGGGYSSPTGVEQPQHPPTTVTRRIRRRGEHGISRKAITQGMPDASAEPVCSCAHPLSIAHETAGAARTRHSLRPPVFEGGLYQDSGASRRGTAKLRPL